MSISKTYSTEAIVLKHADFGEADRILTILTANLGKKRVKVRGARRMNSRLGGHVQPLMQCSMMIAEGRQMDTLSQSQTIETFLSLRTDLWCTAQALYLIELTETFTPENVENYPVYRLLLDCLHRLKDAPADTLLFRYFELQLLNHVGYQPQLGECVGCQSRLKPVQNFFSFSGGGIYCPQCSIPEPGVRPVSLNSLKVLRLLQRGDYATIARLRLDASQSSEIERVVQGYIRYLLERDLKSAGFIGRLKREGMEGVFQPNSCQAIDLCYDVNQGHPLIV